MKVSKYLLLSTTILGLMNPLVALADEQSHISSDSSNQSSSEQINKNNNQATQKSKQQNNVDSKTNKATSEAEDATLNGLPYSYDASTKTVTYHTGTYNITRDDSVINGNIADINNAEHVVIDGKINFVRDNDYYNIALFRASSEANTIEGLKNVDFSGAGPYTLKSLFLNTHYRSLDLSSLGTASIDNTTEMFRNMPNLEHVDLTALDMSNVTRTESMFAFDPSLKSVKFGKQNLSNVHRMTKMFFHDVNLESVDTENWTTSDQLDGVKNMFNGDSAMKKLDISTINMTNTAMLTSDSKTQEPGTGTGGGDWTPGEGLNSMLANMIQLKELKVGVNNNFKSVDGAGNHYNVGLHAVGEKDLNGYEYLGGWRNIGAGTVDNPAGENSWSSENFMRFFDRSKDAGTYVWDPRKADDVTVRYVDENNNYLEKPIVIQGNVGDPYSTKQKVFEGYTFHDVQGDVSGRLTDSVKPIIYTYYKNNGSNHTVNFYDMNGKKIADQINRTGTYQDSYDLTDQVNKTLAALKAKGYQSVSNYGVIKGNFGKVHDGAGYILTKLPASEVGTVKANYVDEQGKTIADSEINGGKLGSNYKTEKKDIKGYTFKAVKGNETGQITKQEQTVTYVYTKNPEKGADVTVKYTDENGQELAKSEVKTGNVGDKYTTEKKELTGYTFKEVKGSTNGEFTDKAQTVTYIYTKNDDNSVKPSEPVQPNTPDNQTDSNTNAKNDGSYDGITDKLFDIIHHKGAFYYGYQIFK
ncbi:BspA family leucine-rich repeat surface protein [Weissella coleopterorum]|uniref:BspA family leucine-rich repeat surface protein n=1 Tax=Weissella coleopterorum TaxID=2714949 RepID=A0A6G8AYG5_9LACO|nr:MucBP domain-containing protein [Weissella coleopterorum]QIL50005.1 BspA family leucine-rich repeat surface protein [Weissella coleopterorum]